MSGERSDPLTPQEHPLFLVSLGDESVDDERIGYSCGVDEGSLLSSPHVLSCSSRGAGFGRVSGERSDPLTHPLVTTPGHRTQKTSPDDDESNERTVTPPCKAPSRAGGSTIPRGETCRDQNALLESVVGQSGGRTESQRGGVTSGEG